VWLFQGIAAFPYRDQLAPRSVYICAALALAPFVGWALVQAYARIRWIIVLCVLLSFAVPFVLSSIMYADLGAYWQGRYGLPYTFGVILLSGFVFDQRTLGGPRTALSVVAGWLAISAANTISVVHVLHLEVSGSPSIGSNSWPTPSAWVAGVLIAAGWLVWALATPVSGHYKWQTASPINSRSENAFSSPTNSNRNQVS